jgi:dTDP-4-dehydrorhamnose reductase
MRILVTGHEGQLGQALARCMAGRFDLEFVGLSRAELDLEVSGSVMRAVAHARPDIVVNCAAFTAVDQAELERDRAFRVNADGAGDIARAARMVGARVIQISTDFVFDGAATSPYAPDAPARPLNVYGRSKLEGEEQVRVEQPDHLILRTAWLFSPAGTNFVSTILDRTARGIALTVVADQYGSPTAASDVAAGLLGVVDTWRGGGPAHLGKTLHLASSGEASRFELARAVLEEAARLGWPRVKLSPAPSSDRPTVARRPARSTLDSSGFVSAFGFPMRPWQEVVKIVVGEIAATTPRSL